METEPKLGGLGPPGGRLTATSALPPDDGPIRRALASVQRSRRRDQILDDLRGGIERARRRCVGTEDDRR